MLLDLLLLPVLLLLGRVGGAGSLPVAHVLLLLASVGLLGLQRRVVGVHLLHATRPAKGLLLLLVAELLLTLLLHRTAVLPDRVLLLLLQVGGVVALLLHFA